MEPERSGRGFSVFCAIQHGLLVSPCRLCKVSGNDRNEGVSEERLNWVRVVETGEAKRDALDTNCTKYDFLRKYIEVFSSA